ncbi:hypothetical protein LHJ74_14600 [Streptomyces sp. N2-109]|uniref:Uncharacterized protein n=1 Tax=Streptomyces gossypii TaxID=2883101 RepID=A0ABT2JTU9_9ACTN|nr:hypothetical protein [Streptomyces gossypii]MCT2591123.1 hypothetical protein [Streptomyces gossypii]
MPTLSADIARHVAWLCETSATRWEAVAEETTDPAHRANCLAAAAEQRRLAALALASV